MENENLFKEIQAYPELNSPLNFFPIINHDLEKYNSKYRNAEKSKIFSSVLFGFEKNSNDSSLLSGELIWKDNLKSNGKKLSNTFKRFTEFKAQKWNDQWIHSESWSTWLSFS